MKKFFAALNIIKLKPVRLIVCLLVAVLISCILYQVIGPKPIGIANNGDFQRVSQRGGIDYPYNPWDEKHYFEAFNNYVHFKYAYITPKETNYISTTQLFLEVSRIIDAVFVGEDTYDIRAMGLTNMCFLLVGFLLTIVGLRGSQSYIKIFVISAMVLFYTDVSFVQYFNSFYSEITTIIMSIIFFALSIIYINNREIQKSHFWKWGIYLLLIFSTILVVKAKTQDTMMLIPMFLLLMLILRDILKGNKAKLAIIGALSLGIIVTPIILTSSKKPADPRANTTNQSRYNIVFEELLPNSPDKLQSLIALGVDMNSAQNLVKYSGSNYISRETGFNLSVTEAFFEKTSFKNIALYYFVRPDEFLTIAKIRSKALFVSPIYNLNELYNNRYTVFLANYRKEDSAHAAQVSDSFNFWSSFKRDYFPKNIFFVAIIYLIGAISSILAIKKEYNKLLNIHWINITIIVMGAFQFISCLMGDSKRDDIKHFFTFNELFDLNLVFIIGYTLYLVQSLMRSSKMI